MRQIAHRLASVLWIVPLLCRGPLALANEVDDLYEARIPVASQAEAERVFAVRSALEAVLIKVTGRRDVGKDPHVQGALRQPLNYLAQYLYEPLPAGEAATVPAQTPYAQMLRVKFDVRAVNDLIRQAGVPLWGRTRPATLLWLAVDDGANRFVLGGGSGDLADALRAGVDREAQRRGVPVFVPMMDLEDRNRLNFADVWGDFQNAILAASKRYHASAVLVGRLLKEPAGGWSGRWTLYQEIAVDRWSSRGERWQDQLASGVDGTADILASRYAHPIATDQVQYTAVVIAGIRGLNDYDRALSYLRGLDGVQAVQVTGLDGDRLSVRVGVTGDRAALMELIGFGSTLARDARRNEATPPAGGDQELSYRLLP
jgi:hypothetical protein